MKQFATLTLLTAGFFLAFGGTQRLQAAETKSTVSAEALKEAGDIFKLRCTPCHGAAGQGDGIAAAALTPKPRDLSSAEWQKSVEDDYLEKIILEGGPAVGKSMLMPPNPDLKPKTEVIQGLRELVRSFAKK
jgi:cytochrome c oxidase cbb3-type subunit 3